MKNQTDVQTGEKGRKWKTGCVSASISMTDKLLRSEAGARSAEQQLIDRNGKEGRA